MCSNPAKPNGSSCDDSNACTQTDKCQAGTCAGSNPVTCAASDQCHVAGSCSSATGVCSNPPAPKDMGCNDGNDCTQTDTCQNGTCSGANPIVCAAPDQCHTTGACNPANGICSFPVKSDGIACDDNDACSKADICLAGTCTGTSPVMCAAPDQCHEKPTCDPSTGACSNPAKVDSFPCDDENPCTETDACKVGKCAGVPIVCSASDDCHVAGTCDVNMGTCSNPQKFDGAPCSFGTCQNGVCTPPPDTGSESSSASGSTGSNPPKEMIDLSCRFTLPDGTASTRPAWFGAIALLALHRRRATTRRTKPCSL